MKILSQPITVFAIAGMFAAGYLLGGCQTTSTAGAGRGASQKEMLLAQAGFVTKTVTTPKQQQLVSQLAVDKVSAVKYQGKLYYAYPTGKKDQIYVGRQAQFNAYKQALQARQAELKTQQTSQQGQQMLAGDPVWVGETAGPRHITVETFDGFGPLNPMEGD